MEAVGAHAAGIAREQCDPLKEGHPGGTREMGPPDGIMRDEGQPMPLRADMAKADAPYFHPRLNAIEQRDENGGPLVIIVSEADSKL